MIRHRSVVLGMLAVSACSGKDAKQGASASSSIAVPYLTYSTKVEEARRHVEAGERLMDTGYILKANEEFKRAVAADSSFAYAYVRVAQTSYSPEEYATNLHRAEARMSSANPVERLIVQSEVKSENSDAQGSIALLQQATDSAPKSARTWALLGNRLMQANKGSQGRAPFEKAIALDSSYALPIFNLGASYLFYEPRDFAKAEQYALAAQKTWPNEPVSYLYLGQLRRAQNRLDEAITAYTKMIALDPSQANGYEYRGNTNVYAGHFDAARADYDAALRVAKPAETVYEGMYHAYVDAYQGNVDGTLKALGELERAIDGLHVATPEQDKANVLFSQAIIAIIKGRHAVADTAIRDYTARQLSVAKATNSAGMVRYFDGQVAYLEGALAASRGDFATARTRAEDIERIRKMDNGPDKDIQLHGLRGLTALLQKDYALADTELRSADPTGNLMHFLYWRALSQQAQGHTAEAKDLLKKVATYNFNSQEYAAVRSDAIAKLKTLQ